MNVLDQPAAVARLIEYQYEDYEALLDRMPESDLLLAGVLRDEGHTLPAIPYSRIDPRYLRQEVSYHTTEAPGTIVVDTPNTYLYYVLGDGRAVRRDELREELPAVPIDPPVSRKSVAADRRM